MTKRSRLPGASFCFPLGSAVTAKSRIDWYLASGALAALRVRAVFFFAAIQSPALKPSHHDQDDQDQQDQAQAAGRAIAPAGAIGPKRKRAQQGQDQDNEQNGTKHGFPSQVPLATPWEPQGSLRPFPQAGSIRAMPSSGCL